MNTDRTRAFLNLRMNVVGVRPYPNMDDEDNLIQSEAIRMHADRYDNKKAPKLRYMLYRYVWEHIDDEVMIDQEQVRKESFTEYLSGLHEDLCKYVNRQLLYGHF